MRELPFLTFEFGKLPPQKTLLYPSLDGIRGMAAGMVVYGHAGYFGWVPLLPGCASIGVLLFFFLSGFLMACHYPPPSPRTYQARSIILYWGAFLLRRLLRIYPAYLIVCFIGYILLMPAIPPEFKPVNEANTVTFSHAMLRLATFQAPLGIYWTIEAELFFYLLYPLIVTCSSLTGKTSICLFFLFVVLTIVRHRFSSPWCGFTSIFVAGMWTSEIRRHGGLYLESLGRRGGLAALGLSAFFLLTFLISKANPTQQFIWKWEPAFCILFSLIFFDLVGSNGLVMTFLSSGPCRCIGKMSYSAYLAHIISFYYTVRHFAAPFPNGFIALMVMTIVTTGFYFIFERPLNLLSKMVKVVTPNK
jgi:peptidoglycan/LPS O-acetylase OafA/YrhL